MKNAVYAAARRIRHAPLLSGMDWIWNAARRPYQALLGMGSSGVRITVNGIIQAEIPPEATGWHPWENIEREAVAEFVEWVHAHPASLVVDIGCSTGVYTLLALSASRGTRIIAIDSDVPSLYWTRNLVRHTDNQDFHLVHCYIGDRSTVAEDLSAAESRTLDAVANVAPGTPAQYRCLSGDTGDEIPMIALDDLLASYEQGLPLLIKCDVEGAEMLVLKGASGILATRRPTLLLSVHPPALQDYDTSPGAIFQLLSEAGYQYRLISEDHEEHWWCEHGADRS